QFLYTTPCIAVDIMKLGCNCLHMQQHGLKPCASHTRLVAAETTHKVLFQGKHPHQQAASQPGICRTTRPVFDCGTTRPVHLTASACPVQQPGLTTIIARST